MNYKCKGGSKEFCNAYNCQTANVYTSLNWIVVYSTENFGFVHNRVQVDDSTPSVYTSLNWMRTGSCGFNTVTPFNLKSVWSVLRSKLRAICKTEILKETKLWEISPNYTLQNTNTTLIYLDRYRHSYADTWCAHLSLAHTFFYTKTRMHIHTESHNTHHTLMQTHTCNRHSHLSQCTPLHTYLRTTIDMGTHTWTKNRTSSSSANLLPAANVNRSTTSHTSTWAMPRWRGWDALNSSTYSSLRLSG